MVSVAVVVPMFEAVSVVGVVNEDAVASRFVAVQVESL